MATKTAGKSSDSELVAALGALQDEAARRKFLTRHKSLLRSQVVKQLAPLVVEKIRVDAKQAMLLAEGTLLIARKLRRKEGIALALRAKANALYASGDNHRAVQHHEEARKLYEALGIAKEEAITLNSSIQPMILLGEYDRAFAASERAREILTRLGDVRRIANLDNNVGNIFHRQDRFAEALEHYERACKALSDLADWEHVAVTLHNMAMCLIGLNQFARSLECYQRARDLCVRYDLPRLRDQADYNIAYLYYFRGEYSRAIEMLFTTRRACEVSGDEYHLALCHLDLSDIYLELNLSEEAREMARGGFLRFEKLGMGYEAAKTLANEAMAYGQQGKTVQALERFAKAREMFAREKNLVWPWLLDLYQGLLLFHEGRYFEARRLCAGAAEFFDGTPLAGKALLSRLLLARIALRIGDLAAAEAETNSAVAKLSNAQAPVLVYQTHLLLGQIAANRGDRAAACVAYRQARKALEALRTRLQSEELKIAFVKNRMQVYEALVELYLDPENDEISVDEAFSCIEAAKSRSMIEMIFQSGQSLPMGEAGQSEFVRKIRDLREELNWYYHRIELEQLRPEERSRERIALLQQAAQLHESELLRALRELPAHERENATLEAPADFSMAGLQASLPPNSVLVEYYSVGDRLLAAVVTSKSIEIVPVSVVSRVTKMLHLLRFQFSKFRMGAAYMGRFAQPLLRATLGHLDGLYRELIEPIRAKFTGKHVVFVPHGPLHFLPFHALRDGQQYLCDDHTVSYAPSATVFGLCQQKPTSGRANSLVLGIPDERAPLILSEVQSVAALLPQTELFVGTAATAKLLRQRGPDTGVIHVATHGVYRQDNPMFSGIKMGDGYLNLYDLYQMRLAAKLVTLSGCATGMNFVADGDELLGLQRGLFCAGASSLLLSLWDVHDRSTADLMREFYQGYIESGDIAASLQRAMRSQREQNLHPYFWAPFVMVGKLTENTALN
jgi:CHAT domain-containing protein/Tfp pilus assembly protein PilF